MQTSSSLQSMLLLIVSTLLIVTSLLALSVDGSSASSGSEYKYSIEHSFDGSGWVKRGEVVVTSSKGSKGNGEAKTEADYTSVGSETPPSLLSKSLVAAIDQSAASGSTAFYKLRVVDASGGVASTSIPVCALRRAHFRDEVTLSLGGNGEVIGLSYRALISPLAPLDCMSMTERSVEGSEFKTSAKVHVAETGQEIPLSISGKPPPGMQAIRNLGPEKSKDGAGGGEGPPEKSFFQKYWYIIVPVMVLQLLGGLGGEDPKAGGAAPAK
jgi:hypothetical protein